MIHNKAVGGRSISFAEATWFLMFPEGEVPHVDRVQFPKRRVLYSLE